MKQDSISICLLIFLALLLPLGVFALAGDARAESVKWNKLERGLLYARIETQDLCDGQEATIHVYNIDAYRYTLRIFRSQDLSEDGPLSFEEWYQKTDAPLLFNVLPDTTRLPGVYFRVSGKTIEGRLYRGWKGLLAMRPLNGAVPATRIIDLEYTDFDPREPGFLDIIQQPMLLDERQQIRVPQRSYKATRVAIAEDNDRNILVFFTEQPCTLWEMARWLRRCPFSLKRAMSLGPGNARQVLGRFAPQRTYILKPSDEGHPGFTKGTLLVDLSSTERLHWIMGVVPLPR